MGTNSVLLRGKVALVTGGTRGIGRAISEHLLKEGVAVVLCGRNSTTVDHTVSELESLGHVVGVVCDVGRHEQVEALFSTLEGSFGQLDILVNNAGIRGFGKIDEVGLEQWQDVIATNLCGPFYCSRLAVPMMRRAGNGFIVNIGSLAGKHAFAGGAAYNASKFGLNGLTEAMMLDVRHDNIRVTTIMPGSVQTNFNGRDVKDGAWKIDPSHIAETVVHLLQIPDRSLVSRVEIRPSRPTAKK
ncbi:MAG: short-chain dehydrogenase [Solibacterales bacterium]|nr:short-chain dehydrogenase [Bryobacterales bacterium]